MIRLRFPDQILTPRLTLAPLKYEDASEIFYAYASKPQATRFVSWPTHKSIEDTYSFLQYARSAWAADLDYSFAIRKRSDYRLVGSIGVMNFDGTVQFGYILSPTQWNKGYATEACRAVLNILTHLNQVKRIYTFVAPENQASVSVLMKCGLLEEALLKNHMVFPNISDHPRDCFSFYLPLNN